MISADRQFPLNSSAATLSPLLSVSSSLYSSTSSLFGTSTTKPKPKKSSSFSSAVFSSFFPSLSLLLFAVVLSCMMCQDLASAAPTAPPKGYIKWLLRTENGKRIEQKNFTGVKSEMDDDTAQNDQPPRDLSQTVTLPKSWGNHRVYYLRTENDEYLQMYDGQVTGTKESNPPFGIVQFYSHEGSVVIKSIPANKFLCMNELSALYMSANGEDPECFMRESSLNNNGSYSTTYQFTRYSTGRRYLGINCDPLLGTEANPLKKASRFIRQEVRAEELKAVLEKLQKDGPLNYVRRKCVSAAERRRQAAKAERKKQRQRWCLNIDRMLRSKIKYIEKCRKRKSQRRCVKKNKDGGSKKCLCDILYDMLFNKKIERRFKRKCLIDKLTRWIEKKNAVPNSQAVIEASKLLVRDYPAISRRMRMMKSRKDKKKRQELLKKKQMEISMSSFDSSSKNPKQSSEVSTTPHQRSSMIKHRKRRRRIRKLNALLKVHGHELIISSSSSNVSEKTLVTAENTSVSFVSQSSSNLQKFKALSVLSDKFKHVLSTSSSKHRQRPRRHRRRKRGRRKNRHRFQADSNGNRLSEIAGG